MSVSGARVSDATFSVLVADASGRGVPGRQVIASAMWSSEQDSQPHGGRSDGRSFATDASGRARVRIELTEDERASVRRNNDWLNITLVVLDAAGNPVDVIATTRYLGDKQDQKAQVRTLPDRGAANLRSTLSEPVGTEAAAPAAVSCTYYWEHHAYLSGYMQIGELHRDKDVTLARFTYGQTADSNVDVMVTANSESTWTVSGSYHVGNSLTSEVSATAASNNYHWALRSQFVFQKVRLYRDCLGGPYHAWTGTEQMGVSSWAGGGMTLSNTLAQAARNPAYSQTYGPGGGFSRTTSSLAKWRAAIGLSGATIGAQSGASTNVRIEYQFGSGRPTHYLYGDDAVPAYSKRVFQLTP
jgi:hypothetical protein